MTSDARILAFATKGSLTNEEMRMRELLSGEGAEFIEFDKTAKRKSCIHLIKTIFRERPDLLVMEGTGIAGGIACLLARVAGRSRYVVSSGDAVGPYVAAHSMLAGPIFALYERILCRFCDGFIGWTPYLAGRALTFGAPRAMTACGWAPAPLDPASAAIAREEVRKSLGIPRNAIVFGIAGALNWNPRRRYCYGQELVESINRTKRGDVAVLIVGGGSGLERLRYLAGDRVGHSVFFTGMVKMDEVSRYLAAMDVASLPQSRDGVGNFRYTTKISEYAAAGLPIVTGRLPLAYDLDDGSMWRLPGRAPWGEEYVATMALLMERLTAGALAQAKGLVVRERSEFDVALQVGRVGRFIRDILEESGLGQGGRESLVLNHDEETPELDANTNMANIA
jgi:glycosyltransferase involved in cell wall biosynthesis